MIIGLIVAGVALAVVFTIFLERYLNREKRYSREMNKMRGDENYIEAIIIAKKLIEINPIGLGYYLTLADLYIKYKSAKSAISVYQQMLDRKIFSRALKEVDILESIAKIYFDEKDFNNTYKYYLMVNRLDSKNIPALIMLGQFFGGNGQLEKSMSFFKQAATIDPKNSEAHYFLGLGTLDNGKLDEGMKEIETSLKLDPKNIKAKYFLACCYNQKKMKDKATSLFMQLDVPPDKIPQNILKIGILKQNFPGINLDAIEKEFKKDKPEIEATQAKTLGEILQLNDKDFLYNVLRLITKLGYVAKNEVRDKLTDPHQEINFLVVQKSEQNNPDAKIGLFQFSRVKSEVGMIPFENFTHKIGSHKASFSIFITTSHFNEKCIQRAESMKNIRLIDGEKLAFYL